jgi:RpiB/LacA/LacB family sugar-phosphate isomerase
MKVGIAADHGGYGMKQKIYILLSARGHQVVDFGNLQYDRDDDYPDFAIPLARAVADGVVKRGVLLCGGGIAGCGKTRFEARTVPQNSLVSTAQPDKKKVCVEKTSSSWMCSAM